MMPISFLLLCALLLLTDVVDVGLSFRPSATYCSMAACRHRTPSTSRLFSATTGTSSSSSSMTKELETQSENQKAKTTKPLSIAVVGSGAVGSYYGARLWEQGHHLQFLFRGENYVAATQRGLNVTSVYGDIYIPPNELQAYNDTTQMAAQAAAAGGTVDWVLVALKSTSLDAIPDLIYPLLDPSKTRVLVIMNGFIEDDLIQMLKEKSGQPTVVDDAPLECCQALYGGMALVCSNKMGPAVVDHSYAGLLTAGVASSQSNNDPEHDKEAFFELFKCVDQVDVAFEPALLRGRWKKMVWNLPFNGISVAMGGITIDRVVQDPSLRDLAYKVMDETIAAANADLENLYGADNFEPLGDAAKKQMMDLSDGMGEYSTSTKLDLENRRPMEVKYMFRKAVERAQKLGVPVNHLETLVAQIEAYQRHYGLF